MNKDKKNIEEVVREINDAEKIVEETTIADVYRADKQLAEL